MTEGANIGTGMSRLSWNCIDFYRWSNPGSKKLWSIFQNKHFRLMLRLKLTRVDLIIKLKTFLWSHHNHANIQIENVYRHGKSISKLNTRLYACWKTRDIWSHGVVVCPEIVVCLWPEITTCGFVCQHISVFSRSFSLRLSLLCFTNAVCVARVLHRINKYFLS